MQTPRVLGGILLALILLWPFTAQPAQLSPQGCRTLAEISFKIAMEKAGGDTVEDELDELASVKDQIDPEIYRILRRLVVLVHRMDGEPQDVAMGVYMACLNAQGDTDKFIPAAFRL